MIGEVHLIPKRYKGIMAQEQLCRPPSPCLLEVTWAFRGLTHRQGWGELDDPDD